MDLTEPIFESREIVLDCFVVGDNEEDMHLKFRALHMQFQQSGLQRLTISPFDYRPLVYQVYMPEAAEYFKNFHSDSQRKTTQLSINDGLYLSIVSICCFFFA